MSERAEMVERVALAIAGSVVKQLGGCLASPVAGTTTTLPGGALDGNELARAAIEAMREPTAKMEHEGVESGFFENGVFNVPDSSAGHVWRAMIDAALT